MANNYKNVSYFESRPEVVKIFDDLEKLLDFCRFNLLPFNEADLYNNRSAVWREFESSKRGYRDHDNRSREWKKPYNRSGNNRNYQR